MGRPNNLTLRPVQRAPSGLHYLCRPAAQTDERDETGDSHAARATTRRLVLLHGVGGNETNLAGLAAQIDPRIEVILLRGPLTLAQGQYGWFQVNFGTSGPVIDADQANRSRKQLLATLASLPNADDATDAVAYRNGNAIGSPSGSGAARRTAPSHTVIAGFSQGGIMSASVALSAPEAVDGFGILSGRILPELVPYIATNDALRALSGFIAHGLFDNKLPVAWAHRAHDQLQALQVEHEAHTYSMGHELTAEVVGDFERWLAGPLRL